MQGGSEAGHAIVVSGSITLECECGERIILLGLEEDWHAEKKTSFECQCGEKLTFADCADEEALKVKDLLRSDINGSAD